MMNFSTIFRISHKRPLRSAVMGTLSVLTLMTGVSISEVAHADPPGDMAKYTNVARQIERQRRDYYNQVKGVLGGDVPENVCQQSNVPKVREICDRFDEKSREILAQSGMKPAEFNAFVRYCRRSPKPQTCPP